MESSRFFSLVAGTLFLTVCAYTGAAFYQRVEQPEIVTAQTMHLQESVELEGIVLREEHSLCFDRGIRPLAPEGERLATGQVLALDEQGQEILCQRSGIFFSGTDGFETFSVADIQVNDLAALDTLLAAKPGRSTSGRLVTGNIWYYWAFCPDRQALPDSGACRVEFDDMGESVPAHIIGLSTPEDGQRALLLRLTQGSSSYLTLRKTGARLLFSEHSGLYLPEEALQQATDGSQFVYTLSAGTVQRRSVEITYKGDGFFLAASGTSPETLREGDRIVIGKEIYEGKVMIA